MREKVEGKAVKITHVDCVWVNLLEPSGIDWICGRNQLCLGKACWKEVIVC